MTIFTDLPVDQQKQLSTFVDGLLRPLMGDTARLFAKLSNLNDAANGGLRAMLVGLDPASQLPNTSGLAGAGILLVADALHLLDQVAAAIGAFNTDTARQQRIAAAGLINTMP